MKFNKSLILSAICLSLVGCATEYPCGEPRAGRCQSVTTSYNNSLSPVVNPEDLPIDGSGGYPKCNGGTNCSENNSTSKSGSASATQGYPQIPANNTPMLSTPTMLRTWFAPYIDADNVFHDQHYEFVITDKAHWLYGANVVGYGRINNGNSSTTSKGTYLIQSNNDASSGSDEGNNTGPSTNPTNMNNGATPPNNTPALNYLRQQQQSQNQQLGMGK